MFHETGDVFVAHTALDSVNVLNASSGGIKEIAGCPEGSGVVCAQEEGLVFAAARGAGKYLVIDARTHEVRREVAVGSRPNGLAWDPTRRHVLSADVQDLRARLTDPGSGELVAETQLPGRPRWCIFYERRDSFLVNIQDPAVLLMLAAASLDEQERIPIGSAGPHGLDLDVEGDRAFVGCDGGELVTVDLSTSREMATVAIGGVPDAIWFNQSARCVYVAIGDPGQIDVVDVGRNAVVQRTTTEPGAHTTAFDAERQLLYVFLPSSRAAVYREIVSE